VRGKLKAAAGGGSEISPGRKH